MKLLEDSDGFPQAEKEEPGSQVSPSDAQFGGWDSKVPDCLQALRDRRSHRD